MRGSDGIAVDLDAEEGAAGEGPADGAEPDVPIEPGRPSAESALFVLLGALATLYVIASVAGLV